MTLQELKDLLVAMRVQKVHPFDTRWKWVKDEMKKFASKS